MTPPRNRCGFPSFLQTATGTIDLANRSGGIVATVLKSRRESEPGTGHGSPEARCGGWRRRRCLSWRAELPRRTSEPDRHGDEGVVGHTHEHEQEAHTVAVVSAQLLAVFLLKRSGIPAVAKNDHDVNRPS
jgi:hypothetical protein